MFPVVISDYKVLGVAIFKSIEENGVGAGEEKMEGGEDIVLPFGSLKTKGKATTQFILSFEKQIGLFDCFWLALLLLLLLLFVCFVFVSNEGVLCVFGLRGCGDYCCCCCCC